MQLTQGLGQEDSGSEEDEEDREAGKNDNIISAPQIEGNKESNKVEPSAIVVVLSTDAQVRPSGDTPSPTPKIVSNSNILSLNKKRKEIKDISIDSEVSLDENIEIP